VPPEAIAAGVASFRGVENRMEEIGTIDGVHFVNDTSSTAPVATVAALRLLAERPGKVHLITGGADKQSDLREFLDTIAEHAATVALLPGSATEMVRGGLAQRGVATGAVHSSMQEAVQQATAAAQPGDTVLLSPGLASFGLFRNEFDRGAQFRAAVEHLAAKDRE
jgi:UDP-N-acetylmuramoylalanine--D-glutamate ligase